jgi:hypothetical protein
LPIHEFLAWNLETPNHREMNLADLLKRRAACVGVRRLPELPQLGRGASIFGYFAPAATSGTQGERSKLNLSR